MRRAPKLKDHERSEIQILKEKGYSIRSIASVLGRSPNTISYELKKNSMKRSGEYIAISAKRMSRSSRNNAKYQGMKIENCNDLRLAIIVMLQDYWNPEEIAGYLKLHQNCSSDHCNASDLSTGCSGGLPYLSKTAIYTWLYSAYGQRYCQYLYSNRYRPKPRRKNKTKRVMIPERQSILDRPSGTDTRVEIGHYEFDSIVSSKPAGKATSTYALAVVQERSTRLVRARLVPNLKPRGYAQTILGLTRGLKVLSLTTDNGIENKEHKCITSHTGAPVYFTDPYSSWQKGSVENVNKMIRRYFPKGTDFSTIKQTDVDEALTRINNKPRKILGYKSSLQIAKEKGLFR